MSAALKLTRQGVGIELRRGTFDIVVDGRRIGSIELDDSLETPVEPGRHTLQVRRGRYSSLQLTFDVADGEVANFRCHGAMMWPRWVASVVVPAMAISLRRE